MILIALGANLPSQHGTPAETLQAVLPALKAKNVHTLSASSIWLTAPVPVSDQPDYHNAVIAVDTDQSPETLLHTLQQIETEFGRTRHLRNEARVLDLDLLAYHDEIITTEHLTLPHPRLHERAFVLLPLQEIAPDWHHPVSQKPLSDLIAVLPPEQTARRIAENLE